MRAHLAVGAAVGAAFSLYLVARLVRGNAVPPATTQLLARGVNEFVFPIGCALVLWVSATIGKAVAARAADPRSSRA